MTADPSLPWTTIVTAAVAIYGAALSTYNLIVNHREKSRRVKVRISWGFLTYGPQLSSTMLFITVANPGTRPVTLTSVGLLLPDGKQMFFPPADANQSLPFDLTEGKSFQAWAPMKGIALELRRIGFSERAKVVGFCLDTLDVRHTSKTFKFDIQQALEARE
jgi:hypothetical protein